MALTPPLPPEWNDSLAGGYLWSNVNFGEAVSEVMTPLTWSLLRAWRQEWNIVRALAPFGSIGGRLYLNASYFASALAAAGKRGSEIPAALRAMLHMQLPEGMEIPRVEFSPSEKIVFILQAVRDQARWAASARSLPGFTAANPGWCQGMLAEVNASRSPGELARLWRSQIAPRGRQAYLGVLSSAMRFSAAAGPLQVDLAGLTGAGEANDLLSNLSGTGEMLASLGPLVGLEQVRRGELSAQQFQQAYGHRGQNEWELFTPRPMEDPAWLERTLAGLSQSHQDARALLENQRLKSERAWRNLAERYPARARSLRRRAGEAARRGRLRETARFELVRVIWVMRRWALRAGELTGLGEAVFFLTIPELTACLEGHPAPAAGASQRQAVYLRLKTLPPYPAVILGAFDPFAWAENPGAPGGVFPAPPEPAVQGIKNPCVKGSPGSAGRAQGYARVLTGLEQGALLQPGEILVTALTDIGWTPLFPRAAAIVTDVGAALSHAAIVARELGIPAVVGCGDATRRIHTGDLLRVDGARGTVEILATRRDG